MIQTRCACDSPGVAASMASRTKPTMYGSVDWGATKGTSSFTAMTLKNTWTCKCNVLPKPNLPNRNPRNMTCEDNSRSRLVTGWSRVGSGLFPFISIGAFLAGHGWSRVGHGSVRVFSLSFQLGRFSQVTVGHGLVTGSRANFQTKYVANCFIHVFWIVCESSWSSWMEWHQNKNHVVAGYTHSKQGTRLYMMNSKEAGAPCKKIMHAWHVKKAGSPCKKITIHWTKETMPSLTSTVRVHCVRLLSHRLTFFPPKLVALARQMLLKVNCAGLTFESHVNV